MTDSPLDTDAIRERDNAAGRPGTPNSAIAAPAPELTVHPLGEDGEAWLVEGTLNDETARTAVLDYLKETEPESDAIEAHTARVAAYTADARPDWWWAREDGENVYLRSGDLPAQFPGVYLT